MKPKHTGTGPSCNNLQQAPVTRHPSMVVEVSRCCGHGRPTADRVQLVPMPMVAERFEEEGGDTGECLSGSNHVETSSLCLS